MTLVGIIALVIALVISIALHELGHMVPAKKFGVKVTQYMIGFGPTLWSKKKGDTEYGVKGFLLGGYIRMIGMFPPGPDGQIKANSTGRLGTLIEQARAEGVSAEARGHARWTVHEPRTRGRVVHDRLRRFRHPDADDHGQHRDRLCAVRAGSRRDVCRRNGSADRSGRCWSAAGRPDRCLGCGTGVAVAGTQPGDPGLRTR